MGRDFDPTGRWLAVVHDKYGTLWALHDKRPRVLTRHQAALLHGCGLQS